MPIFFFIANKLNLLRVSEDDEKLGLDVTHVEMTQMQRDLYKSGKKRTTAKPQVELEHKGKEKEDEDNEPHRNSATIHSMSNNSQD